MGSFDASDEGITQFHGYSMIFTCKPQDLASVHIRFGVVRQTVNVNAGPVYLEWFEGRISQTN